LPIDDIEALKEKLEVVDIKHFFARVFLAAWADRDYCKDSEKKYTKDETDLAADRIGSIKTILLEKFNSNYIRIHNMASHPKISDWFAGRQDTKFKKYYCESAERTVAAHEYPVLKSNGGAFIGVVCILLYPAVSDSYGRPGEIPIISPRDISKSLQ